MAEFAANADPIIAGPNVRPVAPAGFHYRGDAPTFVGGNVSKLCSFIDNEEKLSKKQKHGHMFVRIDDTKDGKPQLLCACKKIVNVAFYKSRSATNDDDIDFGNFVSHMENTHPFELTAKDQTTKAGAAAKSVKGTLLDARAWVEKPVTQGKTSTAVKGQVCLAIAGMIASNGRFPLAMVEDEHFRAGVRAVVEVVAPGKKFGFPCRRGVRRAMVKIFAAAAKEVVMHRHHPT